MSQKRGYVETIEASKGYCGIAEEELKVGTYILKNEAYAWVSVKGCAWCMAMAPQVKLSVCTGCKTLKYCSRKCQRNDWTYGPHAFECSAYRQIPLSFRKDPKPTILLATRLAYKILINSNPSADRQAFQRLRHHHEDHTREKLRDYEEMAQLVLLNLTRGKSMATSQEEPIDNISIEQIVNIFCRINCNVFTITDDECVPVGVGLFLDGALFNHACDPNCVVSFQQQKMMVRTIQTVPKGQELSISYIDVFQSRKKRQQILASSYFFVCECDRCQHNLEEEDLQLDGFKCLNETCQGVVDAELRTCNTCNSTRSQQEINVLEATYYHEMELIKHSMGYDQTNAMAKAWNILTDRIVHKSNIRVAQVARELGDIALRAGHKQLALEYFLREIDIKSSVCVSSKRLPGLGLAYFQIAKLYIDLQHHEEAKVFLKKALEILDCVFGPENTVRQAAEATFQELHRLERDLLFGGAT